MLRYETEDKRATKTGGTLSLLLVVVLIVAFYRSWLDVLDKKEVKAEKSVIRELDPSSVELDEDDFVLAMTFNGINLANSTERYFDIEFTQKVKEFGVSTKTYKI